jgi:hypothetical protein
MRDTIDMAREAVCDELYAGRVLIGIHFKIHALKAFEALVRADEREACVSIADSMDPLQDGAIGTAIQARGNT